MTRSIVVGYVYTSEYEDREGTAGRRWKCGPPRWARIWPDASPASKAADRPTANSDDAAELQAADGDEPVDDPEESGDDSAIGGKALPLSA